MGYPNLCRIFILCIAWLLPFALFAHESTFTCQMHVAKGKCWRDFDVVVRVLDATSEQVLADAALGKNIMAVKKDFPCKPLQPITFNASYAPELWQGDSDRRFYAKGRWSTPAELSKDAKAWVIKICYPAQFTQLPLPKSFGEGCACDFTSTH